MELLFIELGLGLQLYLNSYPDLEQLASNSLIKEPGNFYGTTFHHDIKLEAQRVGDDSIMNLFVEFGANRDNFLALNRCQLYFQAYFISDLVDGSVTYLLDDAWHGHLQEVPYKTDSWPKQGKPPKKTGSFGSPSCSGVSWEEARN